MAWLSRRLPRRDSRQIFRPPEDTSIGAVPFQAAKWSRLGKRKHVADVADDRGGDDRAGVEQPGQAGPGRPDGDRELGPGVAHLRVDAAQAGGELGGELAAGRRDGVGR